MSDSAIVVAGVVVAVLLAIVVGYQVAIFRRLVGLPDEAATRLEIKAEKRARVEANALEEAMTKRVDALVKPLQGLHARTDTLVKSLQDDHDQMIALLRDQRDAAEQRAKLGEDRVIQAARSATELRQMTDEVLGLIANLSELCADALERQAGETKAAEDKPAAGEAASADEEQQRETVEMAAPPASCAPPAAEPSPVVVSEDHDPEGDNRDEDTKVFGKPNGSLLKRTIIPPAKPGEGR